MKKYIIREVSKEEVDDVSTVDILSEHTNNTWQHDRDLNEKKDDTLFGKIAEDIFYRYITEEMKDLVGYITYDSFRKDGMQKHAPFDAILYKKDTVSEKTINNCISLINDEINDENNKYGNISPKLRNYCSLNGIHTVEIKSTKINSKKMENAKNFKKGSDEYYEHIIDAILEDDFIAYPFYTEDFDKYLKYIKDYRLKTELDDVYLKPLVFKKEIEHSSDIFVRIYMFDDKKTGIIMGYTTKYELFFKANVGKCPSKKSKNAIYYKLNLREGKSINDICKDLILWD